MRFKRVFVVTVACCFMLVSLAGLASADDRVVVFGDSWGFFTAPSLQDAIDANVSGVDVLNAAVPGDKASDMNTPGVFSDITSALATHSTADLVHLSIGGNDLLGDWTAALSPTAEDALLTGITNDIVAVVTHILAQRPDIEVFYSSYTYMRPLSDLGTPLEVNTALQNLQSRVEVGLAGMPRATTGNFYGLMQTLYGQSEFGLPVGDPSLPDINLPGPPEAFFDDIHLRPSFFGDSYDQLAEAQYAAFYQSRLDPPSFEADFDGDGDVDSNDLADATLGWEARYGNDLDGEDFLVWQRQLGSGVGAVSSLVATVPEPSTGLLFCMGALAMLSKKQVIRRKRAKLNGLCWCVL